MNKRTQHLLAPLLAAVLVALPYCSKTDERLTGKWEAEVKAMAGIRTVMSLEFKKNGDLRVRVAKGGPVFTVKYRTSNGSIIFSDRGISQSIPYAFDNDALVLSYPLLGELAFKRVP